ncbi:hypothetical protein NXY56_006897 [Leishmania guyanensis]
MLLLGRHSREASPPYTRLQSGGSGTPPGSCTLSLALLQCRLLPLPRRSRISCALSTLFFLPFPLLSSSLPCTTPSDPAPSTLSRSSLHSSPLLPTASHRREDIVTGARTPTERSMRRKKGSYVTCEVNGTACRSDDGTYDVKTLYGPHTVLLRLPTTTSSPSLSSSSLSPVEATNGLPERLTSFTICAVDARGHFAVKQGGTYEVGAIRAVERQAEAEAQRAPAAAAKMAGERQSAKKEIKRASSKYGLFLKQFLKVFRTKGVQAAAGEWGRLSAESKKSVEVDDLIAAVIRSGRQPLRLPES